jgi:hypothetical protein
MYVGSVSFAGYTDAGSPQYSPDGSSVTLRLPGSEIVKVLDSGANGAPVIWRFTTEGYAAGIAGMDVTVDVGVQVGPFGAQTDLSDGNARTGTVLAMSTMRVYPALVTGDCSALPDIPTGEEGRNIYLFDAVDYQLQAAGKYHGQLSGDPTAQQWCVAMTYNESLDGAYANDVTAVATDNFGDTHSSVASWDTAVAFEKLLDALGFYRNSVIASSGSTDAMDDFQAQLDFDFDPGAEPDVTFVLTPKVISQSALLQADEPIDGR